MQNRVGQKKASYKKRKTIPWVNRPIPLEGILEYTKEETPICYIDICSRKSGMSLSRVRELQLMKLLYLKCEH